MDFDDGESIEDLLDEASSDIRFGIPRLEVMTEGSKTILSNYTNLLKALNRPSKHIRKFLSESLGVATREKNSVLVIQSNIRVSRINDTITKYVETYIKCPKCRKPDTILEIGNRKDKLVCLSCGTQTQVPSVK